jgi:hypothetical protein
MPGWIPGSTRCEAIRTLMISCAASAFPNERDSDALAPSLATSTLQSNCSGDWRGSSAEMKLARLGCVVGYA